jgi:hypothetical protein
MGPNQSVKSMAARARMAGRLWHRGRVDPWDPFGNLPVCLGLDFRTRTERSPKSINWGVWVRPASASVVPRYSILNPSDHHAQWIAR